MTEPKLRRFIRHKKMMEIFDFKETQITKLEKQGRFPKSFRLPGGRDKLYDEDEVVAYQEKLLADRDAGLSEDFRVTGAVAERTTAAARDLPAKLKKRRAA